MSLGIEDAEFKLMQTYVENQCGISLGEEKKYLIESRLAHLVAELGCRSFGEFYRKVANSDDRHLRDRLVDAITTNETYWFRDGDSWHFLVKVVLPSLARLPSRPSGSRIRVWSAACSTGQEPYSVAMLVDDFCSSPANPGLRPGDFEIIATDISSAALYIAQTGRYDSVSMNRGLSGEWRRFRTRYFHQRRRQYEIDSEIRSRVSFRRLNLQEPLHGIGCSDLVLLRNVTVYFSSEFRRNVFRRVTQILSPGGFLFLGAAERLDPHGTPYVLLDTPGAPIYQLRREGG